MSFWRCSVVFECRLEPKIDVYPVAVLAGRGERQGTLEFFLFFSTTPS